ncbi:hypothetical protein [Mycobacterium bourgelatii]|nr:hypothetical protein [Mycobacterium bourgelatii]
MPDEKPAGNVPISWPEGAAAQSAVAPRTAAPPQAVIAATLATQQVAA